MFLARGERRLSTLDLRGRRFVLLTEADGRAWEAAGWGAADDLGMPLDTHIVGGGDVLDPDGTFTDAYGISLGGAVLVRPDGVVAWRATDPTGASQTSMRSVLAALLHRPDQKRR